MKLHSLRIILSAILISIALQAFTQSSEAWKPDILGDGYEMRHVSHPSDYTGEVVSTIIRKLCPDVSIDSTRTHRGVLYVHGFNDYFFQAEMAARSPPANAISMYAASATIFPT